MLCWADSPLWQPVRVARRGPPGGWKNPPRGMSTGWGHTRNQLWTCWHSCPTSAGCEAAKKWSLARSSVYRMLLSATKGTQVKGKGAADQSRSSPPPSSPASFSPFQGLSSLLQKHQVVPSLWVLPFPFLRLNISFFSSRLTSLKSILHPSALIHSPSSPELIRAATDISLFIPSLS